MRKKKFTLILMSLALFSVSLYAQDKKAEAPKYGWQKSAVGVLNLTQNKFDNWNQGGEDAWTWQLNFEGKFNHIQEKTTWNNSVKIAYGKTKLGKTEAKKAADEIKLESVFTYKMNIYVNPYVAATALTQFTKGYNYGTTPKTAISAFLDPGYFTQSAGFGFTVLPQLKTRLGASLKETMAKDFKTTYSKGEKLRVEYGAESVTDVNWKMAENILFTSKLEIFSNLEALNQIDVNWDNMFTSKITKYIGVSFNVKLFYDSDISAKRQLKETLAVGLTYTFI